MVVDAIWIMCNPSGVKSPKTVLVSKDVGLGGVALGWGEKHVGMWCVDGWMGFGKWVGRLG